MYHLKVEVSERKMSELVPSQDNDYMEVFKEPMDKECVEFSTGNPRVEHVTGIVHLYKRNTPMYGTKQPWRTADDAAEVEVSQTLCCLAIPADMSVANFCTFIGAYLGEVRSIQVLRREGSQPSVCMVLLTFATQEQADNFYSDFQSLPFSSIEPDILCRLVYVRSVEVLSMRGGPAPVSLPAAAKAITAATTAAAAAGDQQSPPAVTAVSAAQPQGPAADAKEQARSTAAGSAPDAAAKQQEQGLDQQQPAESPSAKDSKATQQQQQPQAKGSTPASYAAALGGRAAADGSRAAAGAGGASAKAGAAAAAGGSSSIGVSAAPEQWLEPPPGTTELPTCPVCLERLDEHISGIVTTVCNHRFHGECIKHWGDTSCPVCRHCMLSSSQSTSRCSTCGTSTNLWICLICGHVGCGRYKQGHANDHWKASAHCYALELETQRVWDYAGDGYVHRLIQSKTDGKLVEVPSPAPTCPHGSPSIHHHRRHHHHHHHRQRSMGDGRPANPLSRSRSGSSGAAAAATPAACSSGNEADVDDESSECPVCADEQKQMKEALVSSKLEAISLEYNHLLATQLDSQRQYFEGLLAQQDAKQQAAVAAVKAAAEQAQAASEAAAGSARDSERRRHQLERKLSELTTNLSKVTEEREFLHSLNETLLSNQKDFSSKLGAAQAELKEKDAQLQDLQEQVRDLMVFIEAQRTIQAAGGSELQDATLLPLPQSRTSSARSSRRSSKK